MFKINLLSYKSIVLLSSAGSAGLNGSHSEMASTYESNSANSGQSPGLGCKFDSKSKLYKLVTPVGQEMPVVPREDLDELRCPMRPVSDYKDAYDQLENQGEKVAQNVNYCANGCVQIYNSCIDYRNQLNGGNICSDQYYSCIARCP